MPKPSSSTACRMTSSKVFKRELAEASLQKEAGKRCRQTVCVSGNTSQPSSSRLIIKERGIEINVLEDTLTDEDSTAISLQGQDLPTFEAPLAVMPPVVQDSSHQRGNFRQMSPTFHRLTW